MHLQTIVAFTDFSASAEYALDRAALVAASHGARLRIVHSTHTPITGLWTPTHGWSSVRGNWPGAMA